MSRIFATIILLLFMPLSILAQSVDGGISALCSFQISERWSATGRVGGARLWTSTDCFWWHIESGGTFKIADPLHIFGLVDYANAQYVSVENSDRQLTLSEGVRYAGNSGFRHVLMFNQRYLSYYPLGYSTSCSRVSYSCACALEKNNWTVLPSVKLIGNIRSDVPNTAFLQRVAVGCTLSRRFGPGRTLSLGYAYLWGGKKQIYIDERHNLHRISLFWQFSNLLNSDR